MLKHVLHPIHPEGWKFVGLFLAVSLVLFLIWAPLGWLGLIASLWCVYFFRDPPRVTPIRPGLVVAPADGLIVGIDQAPPPPSLEMGDQPMTRIAIFLNIFNVHINRAPIDGLVKTVRYHPGKFLSANLDKASEENERNAIRLVTAFEADIAVVQIAGLVARRIVCWTEPGRSLMSGERFGLIRFGSRTELFLPTGWAVQAVVGQTVLGGETVLADALATETPRQGMVR